MKEKINGTGWLACLGMFGVALFVLATLFLRIREDGIVDAYGRFAVPVLFVAVVVMVVGFLAMFWKRAELEQVFLLVVPALAVLYMIVLPPYLVPDEIQHFNKAYAISNTILGVDEPEEWYLMQMRTGDAAFANQIEITREYYDFVYGDALFATEEEKALVSVDRIDMKPPCYYVLSGVGLTVGRLLGLNSVWTYQLARLMNLIFYVALAWLAIRLMPFGKVLVLLFSLLPMTLQQVMSVSYDSILFALSLLAIALTLHLAWSERVDRKKALVLGSVLFLICLAKHHAYIAMALLPLIIVFKRKPLTDETWKKVKRAGLVACAAFAVLALAVYIVVDIPYTPGTHILAYTGTEGVSLAYLWNYPQKLFSLLYFTLYLKADHYFYTTIGGLLGWLNIPVLEVICIGMFVVLLIGALRVGTEERRVTSIDRNLMLLIAVLCFCCCVGGMALNWTPLTAASIEGVQGRYFLPFLLLLLLPLRRLPIKVEQDPTRWLVLSMLFMQVLTVNQILMLVL